MIRLDDLDRAFGAYLVDEAQAPAPSGLLDGVLEATAGRRPRSRPVAWLHDRATAGPGAPVRALTPAWRLVLVGLLALALVGASALIGVGQRWVWPWSDPILGRFAPMARSPWVPTSYDHGPLLLTLDDGRVLLFGIGGDATGVAVYDPTTDRWASLAARTGVLAQSAIQALDGQVVILGVDGDDVMPIAIRLEPTTGATARLPGPLTVPPGEMIRMPDGRAVVIGVGTPTIIGTVGGEETPFPGAPTVDAEAVVDLGEGRALVLTPGGQPLQSLLVVDGQAGTVVTIGTLPGARTQASLTRLADGRVLVAGGAIAGEPEVRSDAYLVDPVAQTVEQTGDLPQPRWMHEGALLRDGRVLLVGGDVDRAQPYVAERSTVLYDPTTGRFTDGPRMDGARMNPGIATLDDGDILVYGHAQLTGGGEIPAAAPTSMERFE